MTYNGWLNYETWCTYSWITNSEFDYLTIKDFIKRHPNRHDFNCLVFALQDYLEYYYRDEINPMADEANMYSDLLNSALKEVCWFNIAENLIKGEFN